MLAECVAMQNTPLYMQGTPSLGRAGVLKTSFEQKFPACATGSTPPSSDLVGVTELLWLRPDWSRLAGSGESARAGGAASSRCEGGELPLDFVGGALRTFEMAVGIRDAAQLLKNVSALAALIFV